MSNQYSRISEHISYKEATHSNTAVRLGIRNKPNYRQRRAMKIWAEMIFEPLRLYVGGPIRINSFFRSWALNTEVGGSNTSSHPKGEAGDTDDIYGRRTNAEMFHYIKDNLSFDQLIWEYGNDENPAWVHSSYRSFEENRCQVLRSVKYVNSSGKLKTKFIPYEG